MGTSNINHSNGEDFIIAETRFGKIRGIHHRGINIFKGIPYGASTEGVNRFMPPVDPAGWTGIRDALEYGPSAPQSEPNKASNLASDVRNSAEEAIQTASGPSIFAALSVPGGNPAEESEDCLVLNVWTPAINDGRKRPVMFWLHGGGFRGGSGSNPGWDGTNLALRGDVVVITVNHRLNVMGFADFSEFSEDFKASGQVGMLDIVHALKWVQVNISQFGGDPNTVMIFGQSGGGRKCETLLAMPSAKGLFQRVAIESGIAIKIVDRSFAIRNAENLLNKLGIRQANVHAIRKTPLKQIMAAHFAVNRELGDVDLDTLGFSPSVDGVIIPQHPFHPMASPVSPDIPVMIGSTRTEYTGLTTDARLWQLDEEGLRTRIKELLGDQSDAMIRLYRKHNQGATPSDLFFLIQSDYRYNAATMKVAERRTALGKGPVYLYYFTWESPVQGGQLKSPHNIEWPFAFDNVQLCANLTGGGPEAISLADKVSEAWIAFARTGNPNTPKLPYWPRFNLEDRPTMVIDNVSKVVNDPLCEQRIAMFRALNLE
ncbi:carboxylesterase/lipase family protein [Paenibacillus thalictri]|uniref:Carboxylic ester hydrolase n=1 Tax=Paenibacillus thalictri TaxID=2527873 RepID=A0A4Q9DWN7_9BACL|nr:carboxylesterase family protein [Paenibacillus thalictri]TBL81504.1 carboxylesterase/lipase family protein [Paenibacillus thalictri]